MVKKIGEVLEQNVFEHDYDSWKGKGKINSLEGQGVAFRFNEWLKNNDVFYEDVEDTYNNMSEVRDGNRIDIHDNYEIPDTQLEIAFVYVVNGNVWATLLNKETGNWYGDMEINNF